MNWWSPQTRIAVSLLRCFLLFLLLTHTIALQVTAQAQTVEHAAPGPDSQAADALRRSFYTYDSRLPLNAKLVALGEDSYRRRFGLTYDSVHDQRVTALLSLPKRAKNPGPAVLLMHGSGGNKGSDYIEAFSVNLAKHGFITLSIDAQYRGDRKRDDVKGELLNPDSFRMRDAWVQTVVDLRRAVDYLETRSDVDRTRIGYLGFSMGGMLGACLGGVESRVHAFLLAVPGGGLVKIAQELDKHPALQKYWPVTLTPEVMKRVEEFALVCDPVHFVGRILPRPLLIIVANHDELIPPEASQMLIDAAGAREPANVMRMNAGHVLSLPVIFDVLRFFDTNLANTKPETDHATR